MAALFTAASTQALTNAAPAVVDYPITVGFWFLPPANPASNATLWSLSDTATTSNYFKIYVNSSGNFNLSASTTASGALITTTSVAMTQDRWTYVMGRFISSTNRRIQTLLPTGQIDAAQGTGSRVLAGMDTMTVGAMTHTSTIEHCSGSIGEFWYANADVQPDGAAIQDSLMWQLAYGGPFSVPHIADKIVEYRSFLESPTVNKLGLVYSIGALPTWINTNGAGIAAHPPLPYWYVKPGQNLKPLVI